MYKSFFSMSLIACVLLLPCFTAQAQKKTVLLDISHEDKSQYTAVNSQIFEQYKEIIENKLEATLVINENNELDSTYLANADVVIILSPLSPKTSKNLTQTERVSIVGYVKNGMMSINY